MVDFGPYGRKMGKGLCMGILPGSMGKSIVRVRKHVRRLDQDDEVRNVQILVRERSRTKPSGFSTTELSR